MKLYFAYGANLNKDSMKYRCPDAVEVMPFYLKDWRLSFSGVATILPSPGEQVPGALWAITEACEKSLDRFESYPTLYRKEQIQADGMEFMAYAMNHDEPWQPDINYLMTIAEGYENWSLPLEDLWSAVRTTQMETDYDLQWSTTAGDRRDNGMEELVRMESGHDLRWLRDDRSTYRSIKTV